MAILTVRHLTTYSYSAPVRLGEHRMMLRPRDSNDQRLLKASLDIEPRPYRLRWIHDVFDNCVAIADFSGETRRLSVENNITLEHIAPDEPDFLLEERARYYPFSYDAEDMPDLARAIERHYPDPSGELERWVRQFVNQGRPTETATLLMTLTNAIKEGLAYERRTERGTQSPLQTLSLRRGSCRDYATLMMEAARALGFAARFVSGYLYVPSRDLDESHRGGGSTHAWCQIFLPGCGLGRIRPDQRHCRQSRSHPRRGGARRPSGHSPSRVLLGQGRGRRGHGRHRRRPAPARPELRLTAPIDGKP